MRRNGFFRSLLKCRLTTTYNDLFLPSKYELNKMWVNLASGIDENSVIYTPVGEFQSSIYWSSSEWITNFTYVINFTDGIQTNAGKSGTTIKTRACRFFTSLTNYNLRDIGPAGGYIFWKSGNDYLEAAPTDQSSNQVWSNIETFIGTTGTAIGTGQINTTAIINQVGHTTSAAKLCNDLIIIH